MTYLKLLILREFFYAEINSLVFYLSVVLKHAFQKVNENSTNKKPRCFAGLYTQLVFVAIYLKQSMPRKRYNPL
jgi:hypothetical protein